jgi:hypothetical protein
MELDVLSEVIDGLVGTDPSAFADGESIVALHRQLARLEAYVTAATGAFDRDGSWAADGARSAAAWVATRCRLPTGATRRRVRLARELEHLPGLARAWAAGEVAAAHAEAIAGLRRPGREDALARDEELLVGYAREMSYAHFARTATYWEQLADPDGVEDGARRARDRRDVYLTSSFDGTWIGQMTLDPISGAIVAGELDRLERQLFEADWARAAERLGRDPAVVELERTAAQRRADALVEMATRSRTAPPDGRRPAPLFSVYVGYETLHGRICELAQGQAVTPGSLVPWLEQADIERAVFTPDRRVEVGTRARFFTGATRRAIELRDRRCTHPYCDEPAVTCQADHVVSFAAGGPTIQLNGRLLCAYHNRLRNQRPSAVPQPP